MSDRQAIVAGDGLDVLGLQPGVTGHAAILLQVRPGGQEAAPPTVTTAEIRGIMVIQAQKKDERRRSWRKNESLRCC